MSHGSQQALVPMANLEMRTIGVHTTLTDHPSSRTTRAHTPRKKLQHNLIRNGYDGLRLDALGPVSYVLPSFDSLDFRRLAANLIQYKGEACIQKNTLYLSGQGDA